MEQQKFEDDTTGELEPEDYIVFDDVGSGIGSGSTHLDLSNLRKRKIKIISSAKETIENGEHLVPRTFVKSSRVCRQVQSAINFCSSTSYLFESTLHLQRPAFA
jgi:hypothetical protein